MTWRFAGYAALFGVVDRGGDVLLPGAFGVLPARVPLLWEHAGPAIGTIEALAVDATGLRVIAWTDRAVMAGDGLSFGYRVKASRQSAWRELLAVELLEISLVRRPMQPGARVLATSPPEPPAPGGGNQVHRQAPAGASFFA